MTETENPNDNIKVIKERIKEDLEMLRAKRKASLYWNIIFFVGIIITTIIASFFSTGEIFNLSEFLISNNHEISIGAVLMSLFTSFLAGVLGVYFREKVTSNKDQTNIREYIKETYLARIDNSSLNPNKSKSTL